MTNRTKGIYWLTIEQESAHAAKVSELAKHGYEVRFFKTLDSLTSELRAKRVTLVIVGDEGPEVTVLKAIDILNRMPDIQGAKLILSCSRYSPTVLRAAACDAFRDILPLSLPDTEWVQRFIFSVGDNEEPLPRPSALLACQSPASFSIPARLVWVTESELWLESRIFPPVGSRFILTGPFAQSMGEKGLNVEVVEIRRTGLNYRFSIALICRYSPPKSSEQHEETLNVVKSMNATIRVKTFLVIQSPALRSSLIRHLTPDLFDVRTALQKKSIVEEPKFYSPDFVIIEDRLVTGDHGPRFGEMVSVLPKKAIILVIGEPDIASRIVNFVGGRKVHTLKRIPVDFGDYVMHTVLAGITLQPTEATFYIPPDNELSLAEIKFPAILKRLHPQMSVLSVPHAVGLYGLARIESPLLKKAVGRFPYSKIINTYDTPDLTDEQFPYTMECVFCDIALDKRLLLAQALKRIFDRGIESGVMSDDDLIAKILMEEDAAELEAIHHSDDMILTQTQMDPIVSHTQISTQSHDLPPPPQAQAQSVHASLRKTPKSKTTTMILFVSFVGATLILLALLLASKIAPDWQKSGEEFSRSIEEFQKNFK